MEATDEAKGLIADKSYTPVYGARPVKRYLQRYIETEIGKMIISGDLTDGRTAVIAAKGGELKIDVK